jgi:glycosyltransferase involved in cell wall biosynthesis
VFEDKRIAVIVPAHNERRLITQAVSCIPAYVDHIIVVDDASTDGTREALLQHQDANLVVLRHENNRGVGAAVVTGYREAIRLRANVAVVMAGDAQMDPKDLPRLLEPVVRGEADYVKGDRLSWPGVHRVMPWERLIGNHVLTWATKLCSGFFEVRDSQCGYTAASTQLLSMMDLNVLYPRYGFPNDMLAELRICGGRLAQVPVRPIYGMEQSGISLRTAVFGVPKVLVRSLARRVLSGRVHPRFVRTK